MRKLALVTMALASFIFSGTLPAATQDNEWELLGEKLVSKHAERDTINALDEGVFAEIKLCVERRAVHFYDLDVIFGNGGHQDLQIRRLIGPGECTRAIDIRGDERIIAEIIMKYKTVSAYGTGADLGPQAIVEVYGRE